MGHSRRKISFSPFCSILLFLQKAYLHLNPLGFPNLLLSQSVGLVALLLVTRCPIMGLKSLSPHLESKYVSHQITPPIALTMVHEENRYLPFLLLNNFTFLSVTYWRWSYYTIPSVASVDGVSIQLDSSTLPLSLAHRNHLSYSALYYTPRVSLLWFSRRCTTFLPKDLLNLLL